MSIFDDPLTLAFIANLAAWALGILIFLIVWYWIIRLAVYGALKRHTRWVDEGKP